MSGNQYQLNKAQAKTLSDNFRELNAITTSTLNQVAAKNQVVKGGLSDCAMCKQYVQKNSNRNSNSNRT